MRKLLTGVLVLILLGVLGLWIMHTVFKPKPQKRMLEAALAEQFGGSAQTIIVNVPSRGGRYPGAVLTVAPTGAELLVHRADRPDLVPVPSGSLKSVQLTGASATWELTGKAFGGNLQGSGNAAVELDMQEVRVFEQEAGKLAEALRGDESVGRARASGQPVVVVTKAYEALPIVTVRQRSDAKAEDWAKLQAELTRAKGELSANNSVVFRSTLPQVVAYETAEVKFIAGNFSAGDAKLEFKPRAAQTPLAAAPKPEDVGARAAGGDVVFAVVASPRYTSENFGDLPAATASAALVTELFQAAGAQALDTGLDPTSALTRGTFEAARAKLRQALQAKKPRAFVLYYSGHAVSGAAGSNYLVLGDYRGKLKEDLKETSPLPPRTDRSSPASGSNLADLAKVMAAVGQELPPPRPGLVAVADLHRELQEIGVPFALVVDGCYPASAINQVREELHFTPWGDYYGPSDFPMAEVGQYFDALRSYGQAPYLHTANPVIFAAKPGTLANVVSHPFFASDLVPGVAPLAAKLGGVYAGALSDHEELSLGVWLRRITDFAGTGEMDFRGSISWSDFAPLRKVSMVTFENVAK